MPVEPVKEAPKEIAKTEPVKTEPAKTEPTKTEPAKEVTKTEPPKTDAPKTEPAKEPAAPVVVAKVEKTEPAKSQKTLLGTPDLTAGIPGSGPLTLEQIKIWLDDPKNHETLDIELPLGLSAGAGQMKGIKENPLTRAKIELGRQLYFDGRLSKDTKISCATCHSPDEGFAAHTQFGVGIESLMGGRNSPVAYNRILSDKQFWDGRAGSLEEQALGPIQNPIEMGHTHEGCMECLTKIEAYKLQMEKIFGSASIANVGKAIASFERAIVTAPTPFDYYEQWKPYSKLDEDDIKDLKEDAKQYAAYEKAKAAYEANKMSDSARARPRFVFQRKGLLLGLPRGRQLERRTVSQSGRGYGG